MTTTRILPSGEVIDFPSGMTEPEIDAAIADYLAEIEGRTDAKGSAGTVVALRSERPIQEALAGSPEAVSEDSSPAPAPEPEPAARTFRLVDVMPYTRDEDDVEMGRTPEQIRERLQRAGQPARRDPPDEYGNDRERFRDNLVGTWSWYRPR